MTENEKALVRIIDGLVNNVIETSPSDIREQCSCAINDVRELGFEIESPFEEDEEG